MDYKINVDVLRWKQGEVVSELELKSEGVVISKWIEDNLLVVPKEVEDLNKDGKVDKEDGKLASKVLNVLKGKKSTKKGGR